MLRLLLDDHVPHRVASGVRSQRPDCAAVPLAGWRAGVFRTADDTEILAAAVEDGLTFLTYDTRTIPRLLESWGLAGLSHAGVVFVDERTIRPDDIGRLVRALVRLWDARGPEDWVNIVTFLERP